MPIFRICFRKDTAENWEKNNPILLEGEVGYVVDDKKVITSKMGDGHLASDGKVHGTPWNDLPYVSGPQGPAGLSPEHKWEGSRLFFQNSDGTWDGGQSLIGPMPAHRWLGTSLQWETPSGAWGDAVDLQGVPGDAYALPPATPTRLGGVMIGDGLVVNESGCISTTPVSAATISAPGIVQLSSAVNSTSETLAATPKAVKAAYDKANVIATTANAGIVKPDGTTIRVDANGTISAPGPDITNLKAYVIETYVNGHSWYRVWSDGWCEQGGYFSQGVQNGSEISIYYPKKMRALNVFMSAHTYGVAMVSGRQGGTDRIIAKAKNTETSLTYVYWWINGYIE